MAANPANPAVVVCMKWGALYGPDYVNVLYAAVKDNIRVPFRFVCLTDNRDGIRSEVECFDIPDLGLGAGEYGFGGWPKLCVFAPDLYGLEGRCLFVDLDTVILGDITPLVEMPGGVCLIREWRRFADYFRKWGVNGMTSIFAFTLGSQTQILERFLDDPDHVLANFRSEQRWVTEAARDMRFWEPGWVVSFKRDLLAPPLVNRFVPPRTPPPGARVIAFHGEPRPVHVVPDRGQRWGSWARYGRGAVPYVREYWLKYGGTDPG